MFFTGSNGYMLAVCVQSRPASSNVFDQGGCYGPGRATTTRIGKRKKGVTQGFVFSTEEEKGATSSRHEPSVAVVESYIW